MAGVGEDGKVEECDQVLIISRYGMIRLRLAAMKLVRDILVWGKDDK